jgi:hypothetical protein
MSWRPAEPIIDPVCPFLAFISAELEMHFWGVRWGALVRKGCALYRRRQGSGRGSVSTGRVEQRRGRSAMSTVTEALKNRGTRWTFVGFVLLLVILCLFVRFSFFPVQLDASVSGATSFFARVLEASAVALLTGLVIHVLAVWLGPDHRSIALIQILDRNVETNEVFETAFTKARSIWYFKGGFGTYFRTKTLPALLKNNRTGLDVMIAVLNLADPNLVESYAAYRKQASGDQSVDAKKVQDQVRETIKTLAKAVKDNSGAFSSAKIALLNYYSPFRLDFFDDGAVLTQDDKRAPAIGFNVESTYYQGFRQELEQLKQTAFDLKSIKEKSELADADKLFGYLKI